MSNKINVVILDDDSIRHDLFDKYIDRDEYNVVHVYSVDEFIEEIYDLDLNVDSFFLDHDLFMSADLSDPEKYFNEKTGQDAAKWLAENFVDKGVSITIHSLNPPGAQNMKSILRGAGFTNILVRPINVLFEEYN